MFTDYRPDLGMLVYLRGSKYPDKDVFRAKYPIYASVESYLGTWTIRVQEASSDLPETIGCWDGRVFTPWVIHPD